MDENQELLVLAAKAARIEAYWLPQERTMFVRKTFAEWNPLVDDGDAFRLAVELKMSVKLTDVRVSVLRRDHDGSVSEPLGDDPAFATRRAIVRAAADIGRDK
ncbi:hypothetical protein [Noviherbaspirillum sp. Root189]|uniref:hypothetical protein n=1 Tax=Noviherbaspirillum sp. Root189 TaxID=1736487 RepID=UPI00070DFA93|nr:hypothetical protein [Noviherbaspirillum sp. Root189]